jgi:hypothetical protein
MANPPSRNCSNWGGRRKGSVRNVQYKCAMVVCDAEKISYVTYAEEKRSFAMKT